MVAAFGHQETVFTVLGQAARKRGARSLAVQLVVSGTVATAILLSAPHWWSVAFLAGWLPGVCESGTHLDDPVTA
jgi:hypothetical protein